MRLRCMTHSLTCDVIAKWLESKDYLRVGFSTVNFWHPDLVYIEPTTSVKCGFEIKPPGASHNELRRGICQTIEGLLLGHKSYLVICERQLPPLSVYLQLLTGFGVVIYSLDYKDIKILREAEQITKYKGLAENVFGNQEFHITKEPRIPRKIAVRGYTMTRKGAIINVQGFLRKKPRKK